MFNVRDNFPRGRPRLAVKFRRRNVEPKLFFDRDDELNCLDRVQDLTLIEREIGIGADLVRSADGSQVAQDFIR